MSNFTSGWVQYWAGWETQECCSLTSSLFLGLLITQNETTEEYLEIRMQPWMFTYKLRWLLTVVNNWWCRMLRCDAGIGIHSVLIAGYCRHGRICLWSSWWGCLHQRRVHARLLLLLLLLEQNRFYKEISTCTLYYQ